MTPMPLITGPVGISRDEATPAAPPAQARAAPSIDEAATSAV